MESITQKCWKSLRDLIQIASAVFSNLQILLLACYFEIKTLDASKKLTSSIDIASVPSADFIYDYAIKQPNVTRWGITFSQSTLPNGGRNIRYQIWHNTSLTLNSTSLTADLFNRDVIAITRGIDEAISTLFLNTQLFQFPS